MLVSSNGNNMDRVNIKRIKWVSIKYNSIRSSRNKLEG